MVSSIVLIALGAIVLNAIMIIIERKTTMEPYVQEWVFDEGVSPEDEIRADDLLAKYGKVDLTILPESFVVPQSIRDFVEKYSTLEFDEYTMDYNRTELLQGEEVEACWRGFYCIGSDGGEISFHVRKSAEDEKIYAFDMEGSKRPEPYASNIRRFVVMRHNAWRTMQKLIAGEEAARRKS